MMLSLYRGLTSVGGPLIALYLHRRRARGKEDPDRFAERLGHAGHPRPPGPLAWLHAASVGESLSLLPLVERLRSERPHLTVLITTGTVTSARLMAERLPEGAVHQYMAVDRLAWVRRFLDHWRPGVVLWSESEFWPNSLLEVHRRRIPLVLVQGRVSDPSFAGWQRHRRLIGRVLGAFDLCLGQGELDRERLAALGARHAECVGNLKFAAPPLPAGPEALAGLRQAVADRPVWLAASTHPGEEAIAAEVHRRLKVTFPNLLTVIVPRHPPRGAEIAADLATRGLAVARRAAVEPVTAATEAYVADTLGELGLFYRLADVVFMGKSLINLGGQNPLEAARLDCALVFGPYMWNFTEIAARMLAAGAAVEVPNGETLATAVGALLADAPRRTAMAAAGQAFAAAEAGVLDRLVARLGPFLDAAERAAHAHA